MSPTVIRKVSVGRILSHTPDLETALELFKGNEDVVVEEPIGILRNAGSELVITRRGDSYLLQVSFEGDSYSSGWIPEEVLARLFEPGDKFRLFGCLKVHLEGENVAVYDGCKERERHFVLPVTIRENIRQKIGRHDS